MKVGFFAGAAALVMLGTGCGDSPADQPDAGDPSTLIRASDVPIDGLSEADVLGFEDGDQLFGLPFREPDGLGPLFIRTSCAACHGEGGRGPGLVQKMAITEADGVTPAADQSALTFGHTLRQGLTAGATTPIVVPAGVANVKVTIRMGPPVLGRGYMEAVLDSEIVRMETEQYARTDGIHGRINRVTFASVPNPDTSFSNYTQGQTGIVGRFGLKARVATLDDFTADAYQGDMGMTTPMRPTELANPDNLSDDAKPGVDLNISHVDRVAFYLRRIAIPRRINQTAAGRALFDQAKCSVCHVPSLRTRPSYPIAKLANIDARIFTDLLLHDMGDALADGMTDQSATSREWRTAPLIGLRFFTIYLHDGRVTSVKDAILAHDGEAKVSAGAFNALSAANQATLLQYVEGL